MSNVACDGQPTLQQQVAILKQQLAQAQKLTAIGELVSTTTHEFNNVLMTIINYAKIGLRQTDPASREKAFEKILAAGNRAAKITTGVLGFARNRSSGFEPTDLGRVVDDSLMLLEKEMSKYRIRVEKQIEPVPTGLGQWKSDPASAVESAHQRPAGDAQGRVARRAVEPGRRRRHDRSHGPRQRHWHPSRDAAKDLRSVLHDEIRS